MHKNILMFQHSDIVTPGYLLDLLKKDFDGQYEEKEKRRKR